MLQVYWCLKFINCQIKKYKIKNYTIIIIEIHDINDLAREHKIYLFNIKRKYLFAYLIYFLNFVVFN